MRFKKLTENKEIKNQKDLVKQMDLSVKDAEEAAKEEHDKNVKVFKDTLDSLKEGFNYTINVKNRANLAKLVESLKEKNIKHRITRSKTEGFKYDVMFKYNLKESNNCTFKFEVHAVDDKDEDKVYKEFTSESKATEYAKNCGVKCFIDKVTYCDGEFTNSDTIYGPADLGESKLKENYNKDNLDEGIYKNGTKFIQIKMLGRNDVLVDKFDYSKEYGKDYAFKNRRFDYDSILHILNNGYTKVNSYKEDINKGNNTPITDEDQKKEWEAEDENNWNESCKNKKLKEMFEPISSFKEYTYIDKTNQGWEIKKAFRDKDDDRLHVVVYRPKRNDYAVGLGYSPDGGYWNQGWYDYINIEDAISDLKNEYNVEPFNLKLAKLKKNDSLKEDKEKHNIKVDRKNNKITIDEDTYELLDENETYYLFKDKYDVQEIRKDGTFDTEESLKESAEDKTIVKVYRLITADGDYQGYGESQRYFYNAGDLMVQYDSTNDWDFPEGYGDTVEDAINYFKKEYKWGPYGIKVNNEWIQPIPYRAFGFDETGNKLEECGKSNFKGYYESCSRGKREKLLTEDPTQDRLDELKQISRQRQLTDDEVKELASLSKRKNESLKLRESDKATLKKKINEIESGLRAPKNSSKYADLIANYTTPTKARQELKDFKKRLAEVEKKNESLKEKLNDEQKYDFYNDFYTAMSDIGYNLYKKDGVYIDEEDFDEVIGRFKKHFFDKSEYEEFDESLKESNEDYDKDWDLEEFDDDEVCIYQFPQCDIDWLKDAHKYNVKILGQVSKDGFQPGDYVIKGTKKDLLALCDNCLHPDYLYHEGDFDTDLIETLTEDIDEEDIKGGKLKDALTSVGDGFDITDTVFDWGEYFEYPYEDLYSFDAYSKVMKLLADNIDFVEYKEDGYSSCKVAEFIEKNIDKFNQFLNVVYSEEFKPQNFEKQYTINDEEFYDIYMDMMSELIRGNFDDEDYQLLLDIFSGKKVTNETLTEKKKQPKARWNANPEASAEFISKGTSFNQNLAGQPCCESNEDRFKYNPDKETIEWENDKYFVTVDDDVNDPEYSIFRKADNKYISAFDNLDDCIRVIKNNYIRESDEDEDSYCEKRIKQLKQIKKQRPLTDQEEDELNACIGNIDSEDAERKYLNGESLKEAKVSLIKTDKYGKYGTEVKIYQCEGDEITPKGFTATVKGKTLNGTTLNELEKKIINAVNSEDKKADNTILNDSLKESDEEDEVIKDESEEIEIDDLDDINIDEFDDIDLDNISLDDIVDEDEQALEVIKDKLDMHGELAKDGKKELITVAEKGKLDDKKAPKITFEADEEETEILAKQFCDDCQEDEEEVQASSDSDDDNIDFDEIVDAEKVDAKKAVSDLKSMSVDGKKEEKDIPTEDEVVDIEEEDDDTSFLDKLA